MQHKPKVEGQKSDQNLPLFAFVPSIGVSAVIQVPNEATRLMRYWSAYKISDGDLLVSGMAVTSLFRLRIQGGVVRYVEPINVGSRVRSMIVQNNGKIILGTDDNKLLELQPIVMWSTISESFENFDS